MIYNISNVMYRWPLPSIPSKKKYNIMSKFQVDTRDLNRDHRANPHFSQSNDNSIGSSNISSLISSRFCASCRHSCDIKTDPVLLKSQQITESVDSESVILEKIENLKQELTDKIVFQLDIIFQISKALNALFRQINPKRDVVLEAETILLLASKYIIFDLTFQRMRYAS